MIVSTLHTSSYLTGEPPSDSVSFRVSQLLCKEEEEEEFIYQK